MRSLSKVNAFIFGLALLGALGCESGKNNDPAPAAGAPTQAPDPGTTTPANPNLGKCMLSEARFMESGTEIIITYQFDENKRVSRESWKENGVENPEHSRFMYNTAFQVTRRVFYRNNTPLSFDEFEYNPEGQLIKKTFKDYNGQGGGNGTLEGYNTYEYNASKMLSRLNYYNENSELTGYSLYTYPGPQAATKKQYEVTAGTASLYVTLEYTFDDKKSLMQTLGGILSDELISNHNETAVKATYTNPYRVETATTTYQYNAEGLPTKATITADGASSDTDFSYNCQ